MPVAEGRGIGGLTCNPSGVQQLQLFMGRGGPQPGVAFVGIVGGQEASGRGRSGRRTIVLMLKLDGGQSLD